MKVQDYSIPRIIPTETKEMLEDMRRVINNGGYVPQVVAGIPAWSGDDGESVLFINGNEIRQYWYSSSRAAWTYGLPFSTQYGWDYITVDTASASATKGLSFGYTFNNPPIVLVTFIGYQASGTPVATSDFDQGLTKVMVSAFGATTTGCTLAIYSGDGSDFPGAYNMGISWQAIG